MAWCILRLWMEEMPLQVLRIAASVSNKQLQIAAKVWMDVGEWDHNSSP
jgi:hypothetical protein